MAQEHQGRRVVITGAASGMGAALVGGFTRAGARVIALDINDADAVAGPATAEGPGSATAVACDVTDADAVSAAIDGAAQTLGGLDVLVHCAGIAPWSAAEEMSPAEWGRVMAVNSTSTFLTNQAAMRHMRADGGRIINFASSAGVNGYQGKAHYAASKGAVLAWTRSIAREWAPYGITVNAIAPGIWTPMYDGTRAAMSPEQLAVHDEAMRSAVPLGGRLGDARRDLVPVVLFVAGDGARFMTGQIFSVDGGAMMVR